jgi:hypothetical protein
MFLILSVSTVKWRPKTSVVIPDSARWQKLSTGGKTEDEAPNFNRVINSWYLNPQGTKFSQHSENMIFTKGSGGKKGERSDLVSTGRGVRLRLVVEGEEWALGTCCFWKGRAPRTCWRRRAGAQNLWCGVLSATTHPQQQEIGATEVCVCPCWI